VDSERSPDSDLAALQAAGEDQGARDARLGELFEQHRRRLLRMVELRMDPVLKARIGASDVLQEAYLEIATRIEDYLANPRMPFFLWIRFITAQRLLKLYRFHAGAQKRDIRREAKDATPLGPQVTSIALVEHLMSAGATPSLVMAEGEFRAELMKALDEMNPQDREVLILRHFEELTNAEAAKALEIETNTASKRYMRALERLAKILNQAGDA
jgi:RNA polymerase sigma-70 factor (ECF subfamily)